jgi:hypothetical protein
MADPRIEALEPDKLQEIMRNPEKLEELLSPPTPTPEPEPTPPLEPAPEPEPKPTPAPEPEPSAELSEEEAEADLLLAELEEARAKADHFESVAGRLGGKVGFLERKFAELQAGRRPSTDGEPEPEPTEPEPERRRAAPPVHKDGLAAWAVGQAIKDTGREWMNAHSDLGSLIDPKFDKLDPQEAQLKVGETLKRVLGEIGFDATDVMAADDPVDAAQRMRAALDESYYRIRREAAIRNREAAQARRAEQVSQRSKAKAHAATSGGGATPAPRPQPKSAHELSIEEADAALKEYAKEQGYR